MKLWKKILVIIFGIIVLGIALIACFFEGQVSGHGIGYERGWDAGANFAVEDYSEYVSETVMDNCMNYFCNELNQSANCSKPEIYMSSIGFCNKIIFGVETDYEELWNEMLEEINYTEIKNVS